MTALARNLQFRGNEVVFFGVPDVEPIVRAANLNFVREKEYQSQTEASEENVPAFRKK